MRDPKSASGRNALSVRVAPELELPSPFSASFAGWRVVESLTLRPVGRAWAAAPDHTVLVARDAGGSEVAALSAPDRVYRRLAELPLPAHRIVAAADSCVWLRCWPARISERATARPFGRELLVHSPAGVATRLLTLGGALIQIAVAGELVLVATSGGALSAFSPDGGRIWTHPVPGWSATPEPRVWADPGGTRVWVSERGGVTELDRKGVVRWIWEAPTVFVGDDASTEVRRRAARLLGVPLDATTTAVRQAFRRRAKETHPDHHPDEPEAVQRFRAVAHAYGVLLQRQPAAARLLADSGLLQVGGVWPSGSDQAWVATNTGSWHLIDGDGKQREEGRWRRRGAVTLAVSQSGDLLAVGGAGEVELANGRLAAMPAGWECDLRGTPAGVVAHCREGLMLVPAEGEVMRTTFRRPAQPEWVGDDLYLFCAEGDFWRVTFGNPAPPAAPPSRRRG
jgi:hypothetical protein